jgi:hypothetical protein
MLPYLASASALLENYHYMFKDNGFEAYERYEKGTNAKPIREESDDVKKGQEHQALRTREDVYLCLLSRPLYDYASDCP